jgi:hypothetical protein
MDLVALFIVVLVFAIVMYCINTFFVIDPKLKTLINLILLIIFLAWFVGYSGVFFRHRLIVD